MFFLRRLRLLTCLVLAWFALSVGVAMASPLVQPQALQWVCSGTGEMKMLLSTDDGAGPAAHAGPAAGSLSAAGCAHRSPFARTRATAVSYKNYSC